MILGRKQDAPALPTPFDAWRLLSTDRAELVGLSLSPDEEIPSHDNEADVLFYVTAGAGTVTVDRQSERLSQGDALFIPRSASRSWCADASGISLLAIKLP